jgi:hypothetical protein
MAKQNIPLSILLENAKGKFINAFNQMLEETNLPAYLIEGILLEVLAETRARKNLELVSDYNAMNQTESEKEGEK